MVTRTATAVFDKLNQAANIQQICDNVCRNDCTSFHVAIEVQLKKQVARLIIIIYGPTQTIIIYGPKQTIFTQI